MVVGADGSPAAQAAIAFAFEEAALRDVPLVAVCALTNSVGRLGEAHQVEEDFGHLMACEAKEHPEVTAVRRVLAGTPRTALLTASADAQMLVVGARGRDGVEGMRLGSVAQAVLHHAPLPGRRCPLSLVQSDGHGGHHRGRRMRIVAALGGNGLLERGKPPESAIQEAHIVPAVQALAPLAADHDLVITHGNGPQVGMLALESAHDPAISRPYPFDVLGAQTQGMIGYWLVQALQNAVPGRQVACLVSRTLVSADDPAFAHPSKFVGPVYDERQARTLAASQHFQVRQDGRPRVAPGGALPRAAELLDLPAIRILLDAAAIVVCAGGGGVPVVAGNGRVHGVEAVVDKDLTASLLARRAGHGRAAAARRRGGGRRWLRHPAGPADPPGSRRPSSGPGPSRPGRWAGRSTPHAVSSRRRGRWPPSDSSATPGRCSPGRPGPSSCGERGAVPPGRRQAPSRHHPGGGHGK